MKTLSYISILVSSCIGISQRLTIKTKKFYKQYSLLLVVFALMGTSCKKEDPPEPTPDPDPPIVVSPCEGVEEDLSIINDFECQQNYSIGEDVIEVVDNPDSNGVNGSESVGLFTDDGTNAWDNLLIDFGEAIDLSVNNQLEVKVHSDRAVPLLAKLEGGTVAEISGRITVTGEWKHYTFDFSAADGLGNTKLVLFFNAGQTDGTAADIYHVDDIKFSACSSAITEDCSGVTQDLSVINDFNCQQNLDTEDGIPVVENPTLGCGNRSSHVGMFTDDGTNAWDNIFLDFENTIDLSVNSQLSVKILSDRAVPLLAKLEGGTAMEISGNIDVTEEWKRYTFDFSGAVESGNTKVVLFFNAGQSDGTSEDIYYVDDIKFEQP